MSLKMCPLCQGTKKIRSLGMMATECTLCDGVGRVDESKLIPENIPSRRAAVPLKRDALPADFREQEALAKKAALKDANCAFKNLPKTMDKKGKIVDIPPMDEIKLAELRAKIAPRDESAIGVVKTELSPQLKAELKALEDARNLAQSGDSTDEAKKPQHKKAHG